MKQLGKWKRLFAGIIASAMVLTTGVSAMADTKVETGSITIENAVKDTTNSDGTENKYNYSLYRVFDFEGSTVSANGNYSNGVYKLSSKWAGKNFKSGYFTVNADGTLKFAESFNTGDAAKSFAKEAIEYAKNNGISPDLTKADATSRENVNDKTEKLVFNALPLGYYLVDSSVGAALALDTTAKDVVIREKNEVPTLDKKVKDDAGNWGDTNDSGIGKTVEFRVTIHAKKGAEKYVLHDKMSKGLSFNGISKIDIIGKNGDTIGVMEGDDLKKALDASLKLNPSDGDTFDLDCKQTCLDFISDDVEIVVYYSAVVNEEALITPAENTNDARLEYGDGHFTEWDQTKTYVYAFDLHKFAEGKENLAGARFALISENGVSVNLIKKDDNNYRVAKAGEAGAVTDFVTNENGMINISGLDAGEYALKELEAPSGYNKLDKPVKVVIKRKNEKADGEYLVIENDQEKPDHKVDIENLTGAVLPSTGGMGTTMFYIVGGFLIVCAFVTFIVRRNTVD